jgi:hypothetical protein
LCNRKTRGQDSKEPLPCTPKPQNGEPPKAFVAYP